MKKFKLLFIVFYLVAASNVQAQQTVDASGGEASGSGGIASYSLGQLVYTTHTGSNGSVIQGVQQPYEISIVLGTEDVKGINLMLSVSPNPTSNFINLKVENYDFQRLNYQLFDLNGKLYIDNNTSDLATQIEIGNLPDAVYFLNISEDNKVIKTFKIVKN